MELPSDSNQRADSLLQSWKEIADYLGRDIRTVQRWERCRRLPIHRLPGDGKPAVYALKQELAEWWQSRVPNAVESADMTIAVLPFSNLTGEAGYDCFCDALADDIITALAQLSNLRVTARTPTLAFKDCKEDIADIALRLHVMTLIEGAVKGAGRHIRVSAQFIDARTGYHLWSDSYDRECVDQLAVQDEVSRAIVNSVARVLGTV